MATYYTLLYDYASIITKLLAGSPDGKPYHISHMYIEFENNGHANVAIPTVNRGEGRSYYDALSSPQDYLRVPLTATKITSVGDLTNNVSTFYAQTAGTTGVNGLPFSHAVESRVYGGAVVAAPVPEDETQDLVLARFYFSADSQVNKIQSSAVGIAVPIEWQ